MFASRELLVQGIVVGRAAVGEGSVRVLLYTDALGLVHAFAKSAREERSKLRPHLQVGTVGVFRLVRGRSVWRLASASHAQNVYFACAGRASAQGALARVLGSVRQFVRGEGSDPYLFSALSKFLVSLPLLRDALLPAAERLVVFRMLAALGYVHDSAGTRGFLPVSYDERVLARAEDERAPLLTAIHEAIAMSGL